MRKCSGFGLIVNDPMREFGTFAQNTVGGEA